MKLKRVSVLKRVAVLLAGAALVLPMAAISSPASAGTEPPPCTKKAIKKAVQKAQDGATVTSINSKKCSKNGYYAAGAYTLDNEDEAAYLVMDNGGKWEAVKDARIAKLCKPNNKTLPMRIKSRACVS